MTGALRRSLLILLAAVLSGALSCGSGIVVSVSPAEFTLQLGGSLSFVAQVTGANDTHVTWSVDEGEAGGTVSPEGLYLPTAPGEFHVRATSVVDKGKSGAALVKVNPIPPIEVSLTPASATVTTGGRQTFAAIVTGTSIPTVSWRVEEAAGGTVTPGGTYTAPAAEGTYHLVATADADPNKTARADVVVVATPTVSVAVSPDTITVSRYSSTTLTAQVSGTTNTSVTWTLAESCTGCSISAGGTFRAGGDPGTYHAVATSVADPSRSAWATLIVPPAGGINVSVSPTSITVATLGTRQFSAFVSGTSNNAVTWTVVEGVSGGTITSTGFYTAPDVPGAYRVSAISLADPSRRGYATVNVTSNFIVSITPSNTTVGPGQTATFSAVVTGTTNQAVTWSVVEATGGTVTSTGTSTASYTAPGTTGTYHVVARSQADTTRSATATVTVQAGILSGNVSYAGTGTGRVYIVARDASGNALAGTSLAAPGLYSLRGIRTTGTVTVRAFMDVLGTGADNESADPAGEVSLTWTGSGGTADLTLTAAPAASPAPAAAPTVYPGDTGALVLWNAARNAAGVEQPDQYVIYWATAVNPGPANLVGSKTVAARLGGYSYVSGLTNATNYYFAVASISRGATGTPSAGTAAVRIGPNTGPAAIRGNVLSPAGLTGPQYVLATSATGPSYFVRYTAGLSSQQYTIPGLPTGATYTLVAFQDVAGEGELNATDPRTFDTPLTLTLSNGTNFASNITLPAGDAAGRAVTTHLRSAAGESWEIVLSVAPSLKLPVKATASSVACTAGSGAIDLPLSALGPGVLRGMIALPASTPPTVATCNIDVTYSDGSMALVSSNIRGVVTAFATPVSPTGSTTATPTFTWTSPGTPPPSYTQNVSVFSAAGATLWRTTGMTSSVTQVVYNSDGLATPATLPAASTFSWGIEIQDAFGDRSVSLTPFSTP